MGFLNESVLCVISALKERWRSKFTGGNREKIYFPGGESPSLPIRSLPLRIPGQGPHMHLDLPLPTPRAI